MNKKKVITDYPKDFFNEKKVFNDLILHDKKSQNNAINFIMLKKLGESFIGEGTSIDSLWFEFHEFSKNFPEIIKIE